MSFPRKRAVTACESCRVRKTKCDNERPQCSSCVKHTLPCSYDPRLDHSSPQPAPTEQTFAEAIAAVGSSQTPCQDAEYDQLCSIECSLEVPTAFASADCLLTWPIFAGRWPRDLFARELLATSFESAQLGNDEPALPRSRHQKPGIREEDVPELVDRFLQFVHSKNPIFHIRQVRDHARMVAEDGFGWDAPSCMVLLACALGAIALPFNPACEAGQLHDRTSIEETADRHPTAEVYFQAARKRLGLLEGSIMASQCHLLSGIYLMYTVRPIQAWSAFHQAGSAYSLYLKGQAALEARIDSTHRVPGPSERRLEQRLYWTVLKSECEIRTELDLPQSDLCKLGYPYLFPSPPSPGSPVQSPQDSLHTPTAASVTTSSSQTYLTPSSSYQKTEEQSWLYYLSEIALRRIENRVLNAFYGEEHYSWTRMDVEPMVSAATSIEHQLAIWYSSMPDAIRFDNLAPGQALDELRLMTQGRYWGIRTLLYRPFLYHAIHSTRRTSGNTNAVLQGLVQKAFDVCLEFNAGCGLTHRHHGTWFGLRASVSTGLMLLAANIRGLITWTSPLCDSEGAQENTYGRTIRVCIERLRYWEAESPDVMRAREILQEQFSLAS
ncbi:hypothetical protein EDB80DRAFT_587984 [Ilyonectria destructans]|nr:hypothetical protein EDB80DRAFT_587984 [Ilyonectria destructans]